MILNELYSTITIPQCDVHLPPHTITDMGIPILVYYVYNISGVLVSWLYHFIPQMISKTHYSPSTGMGLVILILKKQNVVFYFRGKKFLSLNPNLILPPKSSFSDP